jgi:hypothetical protein
VKAKRSSKVRDCNIAVVSIEKVTKGLKVIDKHEKGILKNMSNIQKCHEVELSPGKKKVH